MNGILKIFETGCNLGGQEHLSRTRMSGGGNVSNLQDAEDDGPSSGAGAAEGTKKSLSSMFDQMMPLLLWL